MHRRVRGVVGPGMASVASMAQHGPVGDQGKPVNSQHESMQRHRSDDMGLKDARASESYKADYPMKEAPCGASYSTPSGETIGTGTGKQPEQMLRLRQHPSQGKGCAAPDSATGATGVKRNARSFSGLNRLGCRYAQVYRAPSKTNLGSCSGCELSLWLRSCPLELYKALRVTGARWAPP